MLVVVDMGNTNITMGLFKDDQLIGNYRLTTKLQRTSDEYGFMILAFLSAYNVTVEDIKDVIISSVVPKIMYSFTNSIRKYFHKEPIIVGPGIKTGISVKYDNPKSLGSDRIVDAVGAYYSHHCACLVIDFALLRHSMLFLQKVNLWVAQLLLVLVFLLKCYLIVLLNYLK